MSLRALFYLHQHAPQLTDQQIQYTITLPHQPKPTMSHQTKTCVQCNENKPISEFPITYRCVNPSSKCADCIRANTAERNWLYRKRNKEAINQRLSERRKAKKQSTLNT